MTKLLLTSIAFLFAAQAAIAQYQSQNRIDSLKNDVVEHRHDSLKMRALAELVARHYYDYPDQAEAYGRWAIAFADSIQDWDKDRLAIQLGMAYANLAACFSIVSEVDSAFAYHDLAEEVYTRIDYKLGLAAVHGNRSGEYYYLGWNTMAYESNKKSLEIYIELGHERGMGLCYDYMASIQGELGRPREEVDLMLKALYHFKKSGDEQNMIRENRSLSTAYAEFSPDTAAMYLDTMRSALLNAEYQSGSQWVGYLSGRTHVETIREDFVGAERWAMQALDSAKAMEAQWQVNHVKSHIPIIYNGLGKHIEAEVMVRELMAIYKADQDHNSYRNMCGVLTTSLEGQGKYEEALIQYKEWYALQDSVNDVLRTQSLDEMNARFDLVQKEKKIAIGSERASRLEENNAMITQVAIGGGIALLIIASMIVINQQNRKRRVELEQQNTEMQLKVMEEEALKAQEVERLKSRFFANISHEFRTPLTLILGPADSIDQKFPEGEFSHEVESIKRNSHRLLELIDQLLELSKLENQGLVRIDTPTDPRRFTQRIADMFQGLATSRDLTFKVDLTESLPNVTIDRDKIEKVLFNLLSNAHKFAPPGGDVSLTMAEVDNEIVFQVSDNGPGIAPGQIDKIFDRFYQAEAGQKEYGTGIGLSLAKELSQFLEGKLTVTSEPGVKTTFAFAIPYTPTTETAMPDGESKLKEALIDPLPQQAVTTELSEEHPLVLLVEDNHELRNYTRGILEKEYRVIEAENGRIGYEMVVAEVPDMVVTDVMMPEMNGNELCEKLKENEATNHIPVVMLTAKSSTANKLSSLEIGADDYLLKPFNSRELILKIQNLLKLTERNRAKFKDQTPGDSTDLIAEDPLDAFVIKVNSCIEENLDDPDFSVEKMAELLLMSRSQVHRKISALLDDTPVRYLRRARIHKAKAMLTTTDLNVSEVCYAVGFSSPGYFSKMYKEEFGELPSA